MRMLKCQIDPDLDPHVGFADPFRLPPWAFVSLIIVSTLAACLAASLVGIAVWSVATLAFR